MLEYVHEMSHVHDIVKMPISVNATELNGPALERALAKKLRELLGSVAWLENWDIEIEPMGERKGFDIKAILPLPTGKKVELWVECKSNPRPSQFPFIPLKNRDLPRDNRIGHVWVFSAPHISPRMAELCQEHGWSWFDLAGNCHLSVPNAFQLERSGQPPVAKPPKSGANLSSPEAARILRALLVTEHAGKKWTQRELQLHAEPNVSIGLVNKIVRYLHDEAFIEDQPDGGFKVRSPLELLAKWRDAYRFDRHQRRNYFTLLKGQLLQEALAGLESITGGHAAYATFSAADFQAPHVRQPKTWLYVGVNWEEKFQELAQAKLVDSGENLILLIPEDDGVFYLQDGGGEGPERLPCTNAVQTYVDLFHCGGRGEEAAEALLEQNLKRAWTVRGLL